jgi:anti-sigma B factor antagonist
MTFTEETRGRRLILRLQGNLMGDTDGLPLLHAAEKALQQHITQCGIDISGLQYLTSNGMGVLITLLTKFRNRGGEVYLINPSDSVKKLLVITKLNSIFTILNHEQEIPAE